MTIGLLLPEPYRHVVDEITTMTGIDHGLAFALWTGGVSLVSGCVARVCRHVRGPREESRYGVTHLRNNAISLGLSQSESRVIFPYSGEEHELSHVLFANHLANFSLLREQADNAEPEERIRMTSQPVFEMPVPQHLDQEMPNVYAVQFHLVDSAPHSHTSGAQERLRFLTVQEAETLRSIKGDFDKWKRDTSVPDYHQKQALSDWVLSPEQFSESVRNILLATGRTVTRTAEFTITDSPAVRIPLLKEPFVGLKLPENVFYETYGTQSEFWFYLVWDSNGIVRLATPQEVDILKREKESNSSLEL